ncbi:MAG TPA: ethylbenzene dehydrogenase-related protein [Microvirga sp.]|jgi:cytochrome b subunit of formate dehydrogenase|nr:ethylbenzene dehydrogenase-related protein [Microvirga sp.]
MDDKAFAPSMQPRAAGPTKAGRAGGKPPRTDVGTLVLHWLVAITMTVSLATGLRISADAPTAILSKALSPWLPQGEIWTVHFVASLVLFFSATVYLLYIARAGLGGRIALTKMRLLTMKGVPSRMRWNAVNVALHWVLYGLVVVLTATGIALYCGFGGWVVAVHAASAIAVLAYTLIHIVAHFGFGGWQQLLRVFKPARLVPSARVKQAPVAVALLAGLPVSFALAWFDYASRDELTVRAASSPVTLDGAFDEAAWASARPVHVRTMQGDNLGGTGESRVEVRAVRDAQKIYFAMRWEDPTRSLARLPMRKGADGWRIVGTRAGNADVSDFYEDKFSIIFSTSDAFGSGGSTHFGPKPSAEHPSSLNERGLHFTEGHLIDMWQWKASRGGLLGYMDDQYIGPIRNASADEVAKGARYQGGYWNDSGRAFYTYNFAFQGPGGYQGPVQPRVLPKDPAATAAKLGTFDLANADAPFTEGSQWWMLDTETVPYSKEADDRIPVGTVMPGVLIAGEYAGDRANVRAGARWKDGYWTLEVSRDLVTGSATDQDFLPGRELFVWVAVFDHTQTRHTRHVRPIRLQLAE